jgi:DNA-binding NarL/FixJ family response regulator
MKDSERASRQVGRHALLDAVLADLRADPRGAPVLVTGPRGSGRRTFAASVAQRARRADLTVHWVCAQRAPSDTDPATATDAGATTTDAGAAEPTDPDAGPWPAWLDREADQVLAMSRRSPVIVVLDDLDHTAEGHLERCALLIRRLTGHPVRVVLTVRVPEWGVADGRPLTRLAAVSTRHRLEPLDDDGVRVLAMEYSPTPLSPELIAVLRQRLGFAHGRPGPLRSLLAVIIGQDLTTTVEGQLHPCPATDRARFDRDHPWVTLFGLDHPEMANLAYAADRLGPLPARVLRRIGSLGSITSADTGATLDTLCTNGILSQDRQAQVRSAVPALTGAVRPDSPAALITRLVAEHLIDDFMVGRSQDVVVLARAVLAGADATPGQGCLDLSDADRELLASLTDAELAGTPQAETFVQDLLHPGRSVEDPVARDLLAPASVRAVQRGDLAQAERLCAQYAERATAVSTQPERDLLVQDVRRAVAQARGEPGPGGAVGPDPLLRTPAAVRYDEARKAWNGGNWDAVVALAVQSVVRTGWEDPDLHTAGLRALGADVLSQRGQQGRAVDLLGDVAPTGDTCGWPGGPVRCVTTWAALRVGPSRGGAEQTLRELARALAKVDTQDLPDDADLLLERMVDVALSLGDVGAAGDAPQTLGALARAGGSRARMLDRYVHAWLRTDVTYADEALALADDDGSPYWRAVTRLRAARLGNQDPVVLEEAHRLFTRLELPGWRAQAAGVMRERSITVPRTRRPSANDSADRATLVELVIAGLTNRQIAGRLCVSEKTVERRLSAVLASEGCRSRVELAALHAKTP